MRRLVIYLATGFSDPRGLRGERPPYGWVQLVTEASKFMIPSEDTQGYCLWPGLRKFLTSYKME